MCGHRRRRGLLLRRPGRQLPLQGADRADRRGHPAPGFAFIDAFSPCTAFNNTTQEWKEAVHQLPADHDVTDKTAAFDLARRGVFKLGILYREQRATQTDKYRAMDRRRQDERR